MTRCSCTADRCSEHGEHAPCSVCRDLTEREVLLALARLPRGASIPVEQADEVVLQRLQERGLVTKRRRAWVATWKGMAAVRRDVKLLPAEQHQ